VQNNLYYNYTLNSLSLFWWAKSVQWIFEISACDVITADYTIIMSRTLKVMVNHVMYERSAWFLRVIMSSSLALSCLPSVKKQKHDLIALFTVNFSHLYHNIIQHVCEAILDYFEGLARICLAHTLDYIVMQMTETNHKKGYCFVQCIKQLLDLVSVISRIIKVSVRVISLSLPLRLIAPTLTLIILDITKTSSNNCL